MAKFRTGLELEDRLKTILERIGCAITEDPDLDHAWKIDFVVTRFPQIPSIFAMGVQVTARPDDLPKMEEFLRIHQYNRIAEKVMYMEFDKYADLDKGGGFAALAAMLDYRLNTYWRNTPILGIRINNDLSITTFNLQERISELRRKQSLPQQSQASQGGVRPHSQHQGQQRGAHKNQGASQVPVAAAQIQPAIAPTLPEPEATSQAALVPGRGMTIASSDQQKTGEVSEAAPAAVKKPRRRRTRSS
ncbi:MAG TPA: hypothetical protein VFD58_14030 [Blastocatellia bacterium]|nr:hypothetical protein [Blastocatellia bacterium]